MRVNENAATIYDIAKLAGVNPSTVSRALTTPGRINAATEAKVREAAKQFEARLEQQTAILLEQIRASAHVHAAAMTHERPPAS